MYGRNCVTAIYHKIHPPHPRVAFVAMVSHTGISNKTLSLFSSKLASYVCILVQISSPYRQLKSAKESFWDQLFAK